MGPPRRSPQCDRVDRPRGDAEIAAVGLYVKGKLDLDHSEVAREAWRSMKGNRVALSLGYMTVGSRKRGEVTDLLELDLFEISIVPSPANPQTRILEMQSAAVEERKLRRRCDEIAHEAAIGLGTPPDTDSCGARGQGSTDRSRAAPQSRRAGVTAPAEPPDK